MTPKWFVSALIGALSFFGLANPATADTVVYGVSIGAQGENLLSTFDLAGHFLGSVTLTQSNPPPIGGQSPWPYPTQIAFAPNGTLYGASIDPLGRNVVSTFDLAGHFLGSVTLTQSNPPPIGGQSPWPYPTQIAFAPNGTLYGASIDPLGRNVVSTFDQLGRFSGGVFLTQSNPILGPQPWPYPTQIAFAPDGTLYGMSNAPQGDLLTTFDLAGHLLSAVLLTDSGTPFTGPETWP